MLGTCISSGSRQEGAMEPKQFVSIGEDARESAAERLARGKGKLLTDRHTEQAEQRLARELAERARAGEHFPSSLPRHRIHSIGRW